MATVEFLCVIKHTMRATRMLDALFDAVEKAGDIAKKTSHYEGQSDWLIFHGVGLEAHHRARNLQRARGHTLHTDLGYFNNQENMRICIDEDHPQKWMSRASPVDHGIQLRDTYDSKGPIILVGLGQKSRSYLRAGNWEANALRRLKTEFPKSRIIFRPKGKDRMALPVETDRETPFEELVDGASLVVARHSNCCIDAIVANVPFRAEDGAAMAYNGDRKEFLGRLARWQYRPDQAAQAWAFAKEIVRD